MAFARHGHPHPRLSSADVLVLIQAGYDTVAAIADKLERSQKTIDKRLRRLRREGAVTRRWEQHGAASRYVYRVRGDT